MFLLPRPRRDLPFVLAPMQRRLSPREMAPPRRRRRDQPRSSSERCRAATDMTVGDGVYFAKKKENPQGGMGGRHAATTQGF